jgi:predicted glycoside hydrolase/deacetylase ChbG (UPF0249 family)
VNEFVQSVREQVAAASVVSGGGRLVVEVMVHPGYAGQSWDSFNCSPHREAEMAVLCDSRCKELLSSSF